MATTYIALLRAVNVSGTGKLPMADLKALCMAAGLLNVRTYIASGNVVFESKLSAAKVKAVLVSNLKTCMGKLSRSVQFYPRLLNHPCPHR